MRLSYNQQTAKALVGKEPEFDDHSVTSYYHAREEWERSILAVTNPKRIEKFKKALAEEWEKTHYVYETRDEKEFAVMLAKYGGISGAVAEAKRYTKLMVEMEGNYQ